MQVNIRSVVSDLQTVRDNEQLTAQGTVLLESSLQWLLLNQDRIEACLHVFAGIHTAAIQNVRYLS